MNEILNGTPFDGRMLALTTNAALLTLIAFALGLWSLSKARHPLWISASQVVMGAIFALGSIYSLPVPLGAAGFFRGDANTVIFALGGVFLPSKGILSMLSISALHKLSLGSVGAIEFVTSMMLSATIGLCLKFARKKMYGNNAVMPIGAALTGLVIVGIALTIKEMTLRYSEIDSLTRAWMNQPQNYLAIFYIVPTVIFGFLMELIRQRRASMDDLEIKESLLQKKMDIQEIGESRLAVALQSSGAGLWEWDVNSEKPYTSKLQSQLGYLQGEIEESRAGFEKLIHPDDIPRWNAALEAHIDDPRITCEIELRLIDKKNKWKWMKTTGQVVERDAQGKAVRIIVTHNDIDSLKSYAINLELNRKKLQVMIESTPDAYILMTAQDGVCVDVNPAFERITGYSRSQAIAREMQSIWSPHAPRGWHSIFDQTPATGSRSGSEAATHQIETTFQRKSGDTSLGLFVCKRIVVNSIDCYLIIVRDMTSHYAQQRAREANRIEKIRGRAELEVKSSFLKSIGQNLRKPAQAMIDLSESMKVVNDTADAKNLSREQMEKISLVTEAAQKLMNMVNELIDQAAIETGAITVESRNICLKEVAQSAMRNLQPYASACGVEMTLEEADLDAPDVTGDPVRLNKILNDILSNSIKHSESGGRVRLCIESHADDIGLSVHNSGIGMTKDQVEQISIPIKKRMNEGARSDDFGMGLSLSMHLMKMMGGSISIQSSPSEGTEISLMLPRHVVSGPDTEGAVSNTQSAPIEVIQGAKPTGKTSTSFGLPSQTTDEQLPHGRIIYVGRNLGHRKRIETILKGWPSVTLTPAETMISGHEQARLLAPDLMIISEESVASSYSNAIKRIKADPITKDAVIVVTGSSSRTPGGQNWMAVGADDHWASANDEFSWTEELEKILPALRA